MFRQRSPAFLGALGLFLGLLIVAALAAPRVTEFGPTSESPHVSSRSSIRLTFNRPMDRVSVETRLETDPSIPGLFRWRENTVDFEPLAAWPAGSEISVVLQPGARSTAFLPILSSLEWSFQIGRAQLAYLWPSGGAAELYLHDLDQGAGLQATDTEAGVIDYSVAGSRIVYSALRENGDSEIRVLDLSTGEDTRLLECPEQARCQAPTLSPDEQTLAYEQFEWEISGSGQRVPGVSGIHMLPLVPGGSPTPISPIDQSVASPSWSPSGLLAAYNGSLAAIILFDPVKSQEVNVIPNGLGLLGSWSPDGQYLVVPEIVFPNETGTEAIDFFSHLFRLESTTSAVIDLSSGMVEDASPAYSPDGSWIAFARKYLDSRWTPGRQLWLMRADGSQARPLTDNPDFNHSSLAWSPDSGMLAYMRLSQADINLSPEIWITDLEQENQRLLVVGGYLPQWMP
jgi:TolB protein